MKDLAWIRPRLAKLCGLKLDPESSADSPLISESFEPWFPDVDIEQAIRCLEATRLLCQITRATEIAWHVDLRDDFDGDNFSGSDFELPRAICLTIAAALGWEEKSES